jgi:predicted nucleic-acid-binding Zn-ribbon protein
MELETRLAQKFTCPKCNNTGAETDSFAATGTGFARFFDVQNKRFITVSCSNCG